MCYLCGGNNDFNVQAMITRLMWTIWTSLSAVRERPLNLITHSLTDDNWPWKHAINWTGANECRSTSLMITGHGSMPSTGLAQVNAAAPH